MILILLSKLQLLALSLYSQLLTTRVTQGHPETTSRRLATTHTFSSFFQPWPATNASTNAPKAPDPAKLEPPMNARVLPNRENKPNPKVRKNLLRTLLPSFCRKNKHPINIYGIKWEGEGVGGWIMSPQYIVAASN